jgi:MYXO-CTERM domain-containing protein
LKIDYNDMIISMEAIPDASTWMLFLSGVPALALLRRRRA